MSTPVDRIPEKHYAAIGRVVVAWAHLEITIQNILADLMKAPKDRAIKVVAGHGFNVWLTMLERLLEDNRLRATQAVHLGTCRKWLGKLKESRDLVAHGSWSRVYFDTKGIDDDYVAGVALRNRGAAYLKHHIMTQKEMLDIASEIESAHQVFLDLFYQPHEALPKISQWRDWLDNPRGTRNTRGKPARQPKKTR